MADTKFKRGRPGRALSSSSSPATNAAWVMCGGSDQGPGFSLTVAGSPGAGSDRVWWWLSAGPAALSAASPAHRAFRAAFHTPSHVRITSSPVPRASASVTRSAVLRGRRLSSLLAAGCLDWGSPGSRASWEALRPPTTSSRCHFLVRSRPVARPLTSLSPSWALIHARAPSRPAVSVPAGAPSRMLPPSHQGLLTLSKQCRRAVRGRAASAARCEAA